MKKLVERASNLLSDRLQYWEDVKNVNGVDNVDWDDVKYLSSVISELAKAKAELERNEILLLKNCQCQ